jgi:hypothetical protein
MLFFFGLGQSRAATVALPTIACAHCGTQNSLTASTFSRYFHVFWIPVIPLGKFSVTHCSHCKQVLEKKEMPPDYQPLVAAAQSQASIPVTNYLVLILLGIGVLALVLAGLFGNRSARASSPATPATEAVAGASSEMPQVGAVYDMPVGENLHSLMQVTKTTPDSLYFRITDPLKKAPTPATMAAALRDSVAAANAATPINKTQWQQVLTYNKQLKRLR